jgi:hypothetical protein
MDPRANPSLNEVVKTLFDQELATRPATEYVEGTMETGDMANTYLFVKTAKQLRMIDCPRNC